MSQSPPSQATVESWFADCKTEKEVKKKFRQLAIQHHPDKGGNEEVFKKILCVYQNWALQEEQRQAQQGGEQADPGFTGPDVSDWGNVPSSNDHWKDLYRSHLSNLRVPVTDEEWAQAKTDVMTNTNV